MALQSIKGGQWIPIPPVGATAAFTSFLLDATAEKFAMIFDIPKTGTLDKFEFLLGTVTQAPANGLRASFQDVSATTGDPDGTQDQFRDVTTGLTSDTWVVPGLITSDGTDSGSKRSVTAGDRLACVIEYTSFSASDSLNIKGFTVSTADQNPYNDHFTAAWSKNTGTYPVIALKYNDGTYEFIAPWCYPIRAINTASFDSGTTPDERGLIFQFPYPIKIGGLWTYTSPVDNDGSFDLVIYDSDGSTALKTISVDQDMVSSSNVRPFFTRFADISLLGSTNYRVAVKPTSANNCQLRDHDLPGAVYMDAIEGGQNWHYTERTDAGAWTQTTTKRPWIGLLVTANDDGVSTGGLIRHPGMGGGCSA